MFKIAKIYLVRHGQTNWNAEKKIQGKTEVPLNETGKKQAQEAGEKLKNIKISAIYSSPNARAFQTAKEIAKYHKEINIEKVDGLIERNFDTIEGEIHEEYVKKNPEILNEWKKHGVDWRPPKNGETVREAFKRANKTFKEIAEKTKENENIIIVTHGGIIKSILLHIKNISISCFFETQNPRNCEIFEITTKEEKIEVNENSL